MTDPAPARPDPTRSTIEALDRPWWLWPLLLIGPAITIVALLFFDRIVFWLEDGIGMVTIAAIMTAGFAFVALAVAYGVLVLTVQRRRERT